MEFKRVTKCKEGYMPIVEAADGHCLIGGAAIDGPVFDTYYALYVMHSWIKNNILSHRPVKSGKVVSFKGMVDCLERVKPKTADHFLDLDA